MKRFNPARYALLLASVCAAPFAFAAPAAAQDVAVEEEEAVIVTARRREESLQDVPIAISVETAEELDQRGAENITVLQQTTPNATVQIARGSNSTLIGFIRGIGQQDPLWGFEPGVGLYVDDVYVARPQGAVLDIFDINRIEVLRGPQGTLYGRNTIGGAIKYVTNRLDPTEPHLTARVNVGSYSQLDTILTGSLPLSDTFVIGGALAGYTRDGFGENLTTGAEHYNKDVVAMRFSAEWTPMSDWFVRFSADHVEDRSNARHGHREANWAPGGAAYDPLPNVYDTRAGAGDDNYVETTGYSLLIEHELNDLLTFKSITAYREGLTDTIIDFDGTPNPTLDVPAHYDDDQFTQEFQLLFEGERIQAVAGLFYLDGRAAGAFDTVLGLANLTLATAGEVRTESIAAFADVSVDLTDALAVSIGGRWTRDEKVADVYRQNFTGIRSPLFGNPAAIPGLVRSDYTGNATFEEFTPRASITWEPSDELTLYASYSRGFKSGGFDMRGDVVLTPSTVEGYDPEFADTYEVGFHSSWFNGRANVSGAIFQTDYTDMQITRQQPALVGIASFVDNAASSQLRGIELEGDFEITENLRANLAVGYIDGEFDEYLSSAVVPNPDPPPPATIVIPVDLSGLADFQNTPDWTGAFSLTYSTQLGGGILAVTPSVAYRGDAQMFEFAAPEIDQDAYTLVNTSITWTSDNDRFRLGLHGQNLTDEEYRVGGYYFAANPPPPYLPGPLFGNSIIGFYGPPQTVTASVEVRF